MFSQELIDSANNRDLTVAKVDVKVGENDNWMTPPVQLAATDRITAILCQADERNSSAYQQSAAELKDIIEATGADIEARLAAENLSSVNVMCAEMLKGFIQWTGLNIVATYDRNAPDIPQVVKELVDRGRAEKVVLIIDNLQSGQDAGAGMAADIGCERIVLSNFPGGFDNTETWEKAIYRNVELILGILAECGCGK